MPFVTIFGHVIVGFGSLDGFEQFVVNPALGNAIAPSSSFHTVEPPNPFLCNFQQAFEMYERGGRGALGDISASLSQQEPEDNEATFSQASLQEGVEEEAVPVPVRPSKKAAVSPTLTLDPKKYHTDIPLPDVLLRHLKEPSTAMQDRARVTGFRIELNGRLKGSDRGIKQSLAYGKIGTNDFANRHVDYGKSFFITRRGTIGVKVTVGYER